MEFYNLRTRQRVNVPQGQIRKRKIERPGANAKQVRHQLVAEFEGTRLFKFVDAKTYATLNVPEEG